MPLATVILAAGQGKRMNNPDKSKVMFELHGRPMIEYVVDLALRVGSEHVVLIVGHQRESVMSFVRDRFADSMDRIDFAIQEAQLGTGHAVAQAGPALAGFDGDVLILSGDVPLLECETVLRLARSKSEHGWTAGLISGILADPTGYGCIVRDGGGHFVSIREQKDASESEKLIREINSGIYLVDATSLFEALTHITPDNAQHEYYLTDIFSYFLAQGQSIGAVATEDMIEIMGVNTIEQLEALEKMIES